MRAGELALPDVWAHTLLRHGIPRRGITHPPTQVEILRLFRHKYIVGYYDSFYEDGDLHIVMEYADGGCLYAIGAPQPASTSTVVDRYRRRADGACVSHGHGYLFADCRACPHVSRCRPRRWLRATCHSPLCTTRHAACHARCHTPRAIRLAACHVLSCTCICRHDRVHDHKARATRFAELEALRYVRQLLSALAYVRIHDLHIEKNATRPK